MLRSDRSTLSSPVNQRVRSVRVRNSEKSGERRDDCGAIHDVEGNRQTNSWCARRDLPPQPSDPKGDEARLRVIGGDEMIF